MMRYREGLLECVLLECCFSLNVSNSEGFSAQFKTFSFHEINSAGMEKKCLEIRNQTVMNAVLAECLGRMTAYITWCRLSCNTQL